MATVMAYLSEPEAGGRTIFPQLGLGVKPEVIIRLIEIPPMFMKN